MQVADYTQMSEQDYLALEARSPERHEYVDGNVYAMTGASLRHNVIAGNIFALLRAHKSLPSLEEHVLVGQDEARIEIHRRRGGIGWEIVTLAPGDPVELRSLEFRSDFPAIYEEAGLDL